MGVSHPEDTYQFLSAFVNNRLLTANMVGNRSSLLQTN